MVRTPNLTPHRPQPNTQLGFHKQQNSQTMASAFFSRVLSKTHKANAPILTRTYRKEVAKSANNLHSKVMALNASISPLLYQWLKEGGEDCIKSLRDRK